MKHKLLTLILLATMPIFAQTTCTGGYAGVYPCSNVDLMARVTFNQMGGSLSTEGSSCWGWTDPLDGKEYAIMGCSTHTAFVDITNPAAPVYKGKVNSTNNVSSIWREMKVYNNYAFIVSEASGHGLQIFDLTRLRNVTTPQTFAPDAMYTGFGHCHTIAINEQTGYAYCFGTGTFNGGAHVVNIQNPENPVFAGGYGGQNYTHDGQVVTYNGPDTDYVGQEIFIGANENKVVIVNVTDKANPTLISTFFYSNTSYAHQGWFTPDHKYWILGDEIDELDFGFNSRTIIADFTDLDNPVLKGEYFGPTEAIDHNGYVKNNQFYLANYTAGLRIISTADVENANMTEIGFFDTHPENNAATFNGAWNDYPYFPSGSIIISDIDRGLFIVRKNASLSTTEFNTASSLKMFPNPAETNITIRSADNIESIVVTDMLGKVVKSYNNVSGNEFSFLVDNMESGMYLVTINGNIFQKLIVR
ncbi:MAG TPA: choice-of-anchor B family protein [Flavobacterium sp.]